MQQALDRGEAWLFENLPRLRRADPVAIYNVWGHGYAIQALVHMHRRHAGQSDKQQQILDLLRTQYDYLERYESVDGGWGYYDFRIGSRKPATDSTSFLSAAVLVAFHAAQGDRCAAAGEAGPAGHGLDPPTTETGLQLPVR